MLSLSKRVAIAVSAIIVVSGCGGSSSSNTGTIGYDSSNREISITGSNQVFTIEKTNDCDISMHIDGRRELYVVVTSRFDNQYISISSSSSQRNTPTKSSRVTNLDSIFTTNTPKKVLLFREEVNNILHRVSNESDTDRVDDKLIRSNRVTSSNFCIDMDTNHNCSGSINATVKRVISNVDTSLGKRDLVIWLESNNNEVSQADIDNLANMFLKEGGDNDIFDWVTNVYGKEWDSDAKEADSHLITYNSTIDILLYNMSSSNIAGYFWAKDNFQKSTISASNEKLMFYINTQLLSSNSKETYTTLAHEFQHMIHFYQRSVLRGIEDSTWFDELMSEATEDLIATKIAYYGPRNVNPYDGSAGGNGNSGGRFPNFNRYITSSLTNWSNSVQDYSKVSSFGAYLLRNYDGANFLNRLMYSDNRDSYAISQVTGISDFQTIIRDWGSAVILSSQTDAPNKLEYNFGTFKNSEFGSSTYQLGSINFFNYIPNPNFKSDGTLDNNANLYYKIGNSLSGDINLHIDIEKGADVTIISK